MCLELSKCFPRIISFNFPKLLWGEVLLLMRNKVTRLTLCKKEIEEVDLNFHNPALEHDLLASHSVPHHRRPHPFCAENELACPANGFPSLGEERRSLHASTSAPSLLPDPLWGIITVLFLTRPQSIQPPNCICIRTVSPTAFLQMQ